MLTDFHRDPICEFHVARIASRASLALQHEPSSTSEVKWENWSFSSGLTALPSCISLNELNNPIDF